MLSGISRHVLTDYLDVGNCEVLEANETLGKKGKLFLFHVYVCMLCVVESLLGLLLLESRWEFDIGPRTKKYSRGGNLILGQDSGIGPD